MDCFEPPSIDYATFSQELHNKGGVLSIPLNGTLEITEKCNLRCGHCYVPMPARLGRKDYDPRVPRQISYQARMSSDLADCAAETGAMVQESCAGCVPSRAESRGRSELSFDEICRIMDEIAAEGCLWLLITGGEPMMRADFADIYEYAKRKGFLISLFTNGTMINERIADLFASFPPFVVEVSLYGAAKGTYEAITGVSGSYERCMRGIDLLLERRMPLKLKTMVLRPNVHELGEMARFAESKGVSFRWDPLVHPQVNSSTESLEMRLSPEEIVQVELNDSGRVAGWLELCERYAGKRRIKTLFGCGAGRGMFHIDSYGYLQPCGFARRYSFDLRVGRFREGFHGYFPTVLSKTRAGTTDCDQCDLFAICGICPAWEEVENEGREGPIEFIHQYACLLSDGLKKLNI